MTDPEMGRKSQIGDVGEPVRGRPRSEAADLAISRATLHLLATEGLESTTMAAIARSAGVSTATLYRRYASRSDVVVDALSRGSESLAVPDTGSLSSDLRVYFTNLIQDLTDEHGARIIRALLDEAQRDPVLANAVDTNMAAPARKGLLHILRRAQTRGEISRRFDTEVVADFALGPIYHRWFQALRPLDDEFREGLIQLITAALVDGTQVNQEQNGTSKD